MSVTQDRMEEALNFLALTDEEAAEMRTEVERCALRCKRARAFAFEAGTGSVESRKAQAENSEPVVQAEDDRIAAFLAFETIKAKRERAELVVDVWRSLGANRRAGNIT